MTSKIKIGKSEAAALAIIAITGVVVRAIGYDSESYWGDEIYTLVESGYPLAELFSAKWLSAGQMPGHFLLIKFWRMIVGENRFLLLAPNFLLGGATAIAVRAAARRAGGSSPASLLAALLTAVHPLQVEHAQQLRSYPTVVFLAALFIYFYLRSISDWRFGISLAPLGLLMLMFHGATALLPAAAFILIPFGGKFMSRRKLARFVGLSIYGLIASAIIIRGADLAEMKAASAAIKIGPGLGLPLLYFFSGAVYSAGHFFDPRQFVTAESVIGIALVFPLILLAIVRSINQKERTTELLLISLTLTIGIALHYAPYLGQPKYLIFFFPVAHIVAGRGVDLFRPKRAVYLATIAGIVYFTAAGINLKQRLEKIDMPQYREAAALVDISSGDKELVHVFKNSEFNPFAYYYKGNNLLSEKQLRKMKTESKRRRAPGGFAEDFKSMLAGHPGFWLIKGGGDILAEKDSQRGIPRPPNGWDILWRASQVEDDIRKAVEDTYPAVEKKELNLIEISHYFYPPVTSSTGRPTAPTPNPEEAE